MLISKQKKAGVPGKRFSRELNVQIEKDVLALMKSKGWSAGRRSLIRSSNDWAFGQVKSLSERQTEAEVKLGP